MGVHSCSWKAKVLYSNKRNILNPLMTCFIFVLQLRQSHPSFQCTPIMYGARAGSTLCSSFRKDELLLNRVLEVIARSSILKVPFKTFQKICMWGWPEKQTWKWSLRALEYIFLNSETDSLLLCRDTKDPVGTLHGVIICPNVKCSLIHIRVRKSVGIWDAV